MNGNDERRRRRNDGGDKGVEVGRRLNDLTENR